MAIRLLLMCCCCSRSFFIVIVFVVVCVSILSGSSDKLSMVDIPRINTFSALQSESQTIKAGQYSCRSTGLNSVDKDTAVNAFLLRMCSVAIIALRGPQTSRQCPDPGLIARFGSFTVHCNQPKKTDSSDTARDHWIRGPRLKTYAGSAKAERSARSKVVNKENE